MLNSAITERLRALNLPSNQLYKAIETEFDGRLFRSRLEARWAVFFRTLAIEYLYEPESFDFGDERYMPDFFLPRVRMWAEVKPAEVTNRELRLVGKLANATKRPAFLLIGIPDRRGYTVVHPVDEESGDFFCCEYLLDPFWNGKRIYDEQSRFYGDLTGGEIDFLSMQYHDAVFAARSARFGDGGRW